MAAGFSRWLYQTQELTLLSDEATGLASKPDESEARIPRAGSARRARGARCREANCAAKYAPKTATLMEKIRRAEDAVKREGQASQAKLQTTISIGGSILGALLRRQGGGSAGNISGLAAPRLAARGVGRAT